MGRKVAKPEPIDLTIYQKLRQLGGSPQMVYLAAKSDGLNTIECIVAVRKVFDLNLVQAKEVMVIAEGMGTSLNDYQEKLVPGLKKTFWILDQEAAGRLYSEIRFNGGILGYALLDRHNSFYAVEWLTNYSPETQAAIELLQRGNELEIEFGDANKQKGILAWNISGQFLIHPI